MNLFTAGKRVSRETGPSFLAARVKAGVSRETSLDPSEPNGKAALVSNSPADVVSRETGPTDQSRPSVSALIGGTRAEAAQAASGSITEGTTAETGPLSAANAEADGSGPDVVDEPADLGRSEDVSGIDLEFDTPIAREAATAMHVQNIQQETWPRPSSVRVFTVANQKGGVGKTTSTVNIAAALALHGLRVLVIDLDPQGNASTALGVAHGVGTPSIYDVLLGDLTLDEVATTAEFAPTLKVVPSTIDLAGAELELTSQVAREYRLQRALSEFLENSDDVDYIFIDCPPSLGLLTLNALVAAREVLIPIQCEYYALEGLAQLLGTIEMVQSYLNKIIAVSTVLLTMYDSRTRLADQVAEEVRRHFGALAIEAVIPRNVRVSEAPGYGQTVMTYDAGSRGAVAYLQAAREVAYRAETAGPGDASAAGDQTNVTVGASTETEPTTPGMDGT